MKIIQAVAPTLECITLAELKLFLRIDAGSFSDNIDTSQSITSGDHAIAAAYSLVGTSVDVLGYSAVVNLNSGTNGATGTVDVKIQESDDDVTYTDWTGGAFIQVTVANDNATQEIEYTGVKQYVRTVATVALATCDFGTTVIRLTATSIEDDLLNDIITSAREHVEDITRRSLLTQTWDYYLDEWPDGDKIELPFGNLQTDGLSVKYTDSDGDQTTMTLTTDYLIETNGEGCGYIVLPYGESWPSFTAYPSNPIVVRYVAGWTTAALVPYKIKAACKLIASDLYSNREAQIVSGQDYRENLTVQRLLASARLFDEF
jgi:uncharacterized phiE125 gp8 family phage protein